MSERRELEEEWGEGFNGDFEGIVMGGVGNAWSALGSWSLTGDFGSDWIWGFFIFISPLLVWIVVNFSSSFFSRRNMFDNIFYS